MERPAGRLRAALRRRSVRRWTVVLLILLGVTLPVGARLARSLGPDGVATYEVRPIHFVREVEAEGTFKAVKATPVVVPPETGRPQKVAWLARNGSALAAGDTIVEFDPYDAQREAADGQADLTAARARVAKAEAEGSKQERSVALDQDLARGDLARAEKFKLTDEALYSRQEIIESRLDRELSATKLDVSGKRLSASGKLTSAERALGEIDAGKAELKLQIAGKSLRSLRIAAPHPGLLVLERNWRGETTFVGDTLWPGQKIAELPDLSQLEAKVFVLEADGAGLKPGIGARLVIEGRPGEEHQAKLVRVEPLAKPREMGSPVKFFEATLSLERTEPAYMKPGQRVRALLRIEEAEGVLAIPRGAVFDRDGKRVVYRRGRAGFTPVEVGIRLQSISRVVIDRGLSAGDLIALRDPTAKRPATASPAEAGAGGTGR